MTVHLPEDLELFVRMQVASGRFPSEDEAISAAVRLLRRFEALLPRAPAVPSAQDTPPAGPEPAWRRVLETMQDVPDEVFDRIPADSSAQLDHYLYGTPKRPAS